MLEYFKFTHRDGITRRVRFVCRVSICTRGGGIGIYRQGIHIWKGEAGIHALGLM